MRTTKDVFKEARAIAKLFGVNLRYEKVDVNEGSGYYDMDFNEIVLDKEQYFYKDLFAEDGFMSGFFHELAHHYQHTNGLFIKLFTAAPQEAYKVALRAEHHADCLGAELMSLFYPELHYFAGYTDNENDRKFLKNIYLS